MSSYTLWLALVPAMQLSVAVAYAQSTAVSGSTATSASNAADATSAQGSIASHALLHNDLELAHWVVNHSADVEASRAEVRAQRAAASGTRLFTNPTVDIGAGNFALGKPNPADLPRNKTMQYVVGVSQTFELGKRGPRIAAADLTATSSQARLQNTVATRVGVARGALAELLYNRVKTQQLEASLQEARAATAIAQGRLAHDALSGVDFDRMLIDLAALETDRAHAEADALSALSQCEAALQAPCNVEADVDTLDAAAPVPTVGATDDDLRKRADIRSLVLDSQSALKNADLAAARAIPDLTFRLGYTHDEFTVSGSLSNSLALTVSAPIPVFDRGQFDKAQALANAAQARAQAQAEFIRARGDLNGLYARKRAVEGALYNLEHDSLPRANAVLEAEERGLKEGQLDLNDLLLARRAAIAVRLQTLELHFELFQVRNALRQVMGLDQALTQG